VAHPRPGRRQGAARAGARGVHEQAQVPDDTGSPCAAKWSLCTVTKVEETQQILKLAPLLVTMLVPCTLIAQTNTLFVKQGTTMNRHMGPPHFQIPPASLGAFVTLTMLVAVVVYTTGSLSGPSDGTPRTRKGSPY
jgi:hypothetical protein